MKYLNFLIIFFCFLFLGIGFINASSDDNVSGWAWSGNIGWISFNNINNGGGIEYGVKIDSNGDFSGWAWSDNIGWISFNQGNTGAPPSDDPCGINCIASLDDNNVLGWARALSYGDGWDGWIRFDHGQSDEVSVDSNGDFHGYAWGDDVIGWISFNSEGGEVDYEVTTSFSFNESPVSEIRYLDMSVDEGGTWENEDFARHIVDVDPDGPEDLDKCYYFFNVCDSSGSCQNTNEEERGCNQDIEITVGETDNCSEQSENACTLYVYSIDVANNTSELDSATYDIDWEDPIIDSVLPVTAAVDDEQEFLTTASDNFDIVSCDLYIGESSVSTTIGTSYSCGDNICYPISANYTFDSEGTYPMYFICADHYDRHNQGLNIGYGSSVDVMVYNPVIDSLTYTTSPCSVATTQDNCIVNFSVIAHDPDGGNLTYSWDFNNDEVPDSTEQNPSYHFDNPSSRVRVTVTDNEGSSITETVSGLIVSNPTLAVGLSANPEQGILNVELNGLEEKIDLSATVSGNTFGTINYKFDCTDDASYELEVWHTEENPYTAIDVCDYSEVGEYTARVYVDRGSGNAENTITINVTGPECLIEDIPNCSTCKYPDCNVETGEWFCENSSFGSDCGNCNICDGLGNCGEQCSSGENNCECKLDSCIDCSDYYNPGGPTCGYQGPSGTCNCSEYEIPIWDCSFGDCRCICSNTGVCGEQPIECSRNNPNVILSPLSASGIQGQTLTYEVNVINNNTGSDCGNSTFLLEESCPVGWTCSLVDSLVIPSGSSDSAYLSVTSSGIAEKGDYDISVTANTTYGGIEYSRTGSAIYNVANSAPTASISCSPGDCSAYYGDAEEILSLINGSSDPDGNDDIVKSRWDIYNYGSEYDLECDYLCNYTPQLGVGNYVIELYVEDQNGASDTITKNFTILQDAIADFECSLSPDGPWRDCDDDSGFTASEDEVVYFKDVSTYSEYASSIVNREWTFKDGDPSESEEEYASAVFSIEDASSGFITLDILDDIGRESTHYGQINITLPLPEWWEIKPE